MNNRKHLFIPVATALVIALGLTHAASAQVVVDQTADAEAQGSGGGATIGDGQFVAQTFTVGVAGVLDTVELQVKQIETPQPPTGDLVLRILGTTAGEPDFGQFFGSVVVPRTNVPLASDFTGFPWVPIDENKARVTEVVEIKRVMGSSLGGL